MEIEGEILGLVILFLVICAGFYFFVVHDSGSSAPEGLLANKTQNRSLGSNLSINRSAGNVSGTNLTLNDSFIDVEELHWNHMPLSYKFVNNISRCEGAPIVKMQEAFAEIQKASQNKVRFVEVFGNDTTDINVTCVDRQALLDTLGKYESCKTVLLDYRSAQFSGYEVLSSNDFVTSLTLVSRNDTINTYKLCYVNKRAGFSFNWSLLEEAEPVVKKGIIVWGNKNIYTVDSEYAYCTGFPAKEVHDIMHLLGFAHAETPVFHEHYGWFSKDERYFRDIMFPYPYCAYMSEINDNYAKCLEYIYSDGESGEGCANVNFVT